MRLNYKTLGKFIRQINTKNTDGSITKLLGVNLSKQLMPSVANTHGVDLTKYKVLSKNQFACKFMSVGRDEKLPIGLYREDNEAIVSSAYFVFESENEEILDSQYLMMWLSRPENDRLLWFKSGADVRGSISWNDFCEIEIPVPPIEKQREIVREYNVVNDRILLNEQLTQKLENTAQALYKKWFVDFEFPISKEYAESIGNPELEGKQFGLVEGELPRLWSLKSLSEISKIKGGKRLPKGESLSESVTHYPYVTVKDMKPTKSLVLESDFRYVPESIQPKISSYTVAKGDLILAIVGATIGKVNIIHHSLNTANLTENCVKITDLTKLSTSYLYHYFRSNEGKQEIQQRIVGGAQGKLPIYNVESLNVVVPDESTFRHFMRIIRPLDKLSELKTFENVELNKIKKLLLSKMAIA